MRAFFRVRQNMRVQGDVVRELRKAHKVRTPLHALYPVESSSDSMQSGGTYSRRPAQGTNISSLYALVIAGCWTGRACNVELTRFTKRNSYVCYPPSPHRPLSLKQPLKAWYEKMRNRPIMTGGYLRPTLFNKALPRLVPQPAHITGMITSRRKARDRRMVKFDTIQEYARLLNTEFKFEEALVNAAEKEGQPVERVFTKDPVEWRAYFHAGLRVFPYFAC